MPDVHYGKGATVGSVIPCKGAIIPAAVGVDIGCGMNALRLSIKADELPDNMRRIRLAIEEAIPVGFDKHKSDKAKASTIRGLSVGLDKLLAKHPKLLKMQKKPYQTWVRQLGTLGGGNHLIEICLDENNDVWIMLHSGSRGVGNIIGQYFIRLAQKDMSKHIHNLPDKDLAYFDDYVAAVHWAQDYAMNNRREMMRLIVDALKKNLPKFGMTKEAINCHHNYVAIENHFGENVHIKRKGAISAAEGELGIIPGSMGAKSFIVRGKAKRHFTEADMGAQTKGIECRKDKGVIDEIPGAYKDIDGVMANQNDLVDVEHNLRQIVFVKG